jgi:DNA-binding transcriptional regulator YhcF (GntR family)
MNYTFENNIPIYVQLLEQIKIQIISGCYAAGERLPSVRDLSLKLKVNPNTLQRALSELEEMGLIYTERTNGKFVTDNAELITKYKNEHAKKIAEKYFLGMAQIGFGENDAIGFLKELGGND